MSSQDSVSSEQGDTLPNHRELLKVLIVAFVAATWDSTFLVAELCVVGFAIFVPLSAWAVLGYFVLVFGLAILASDMPFAVGGFRVYGADILAVFFAAWAVRKLIASLLEQNFSINRPSAERSLIRAFLALAAYGVIAAAVGIANGHPLRDVLGDYRRQFFYALAFLLPLIMRLRRPHLDAVKFALFAAVAATTIIGLRRFARGESWAPDSYMIVGFDPRFLSATELVPLSSCLAYVSVVLRSRVSFAIKSLALCGASVAFIMLFISGWRMGLLLSVGAPAAAMFLLTWTRREPLSGPVKAAATLATLAVVGAMVLAFAFPDAADGQLQRTLDRFSHLNPADDQRYYTWLEALNTYRANPLFGAGLGHQLWFYMRSSAGVMIGATGTTHNYLLEVLYRGGPIAILLVLGIQVAFNLYVLRNVRAVPLRDQAIVIGLYVGYLCCFFIHLLEPNTPAGVAALYLSMGFVVRFLRDCDGSNAVTEASPLAQSPHSDPAPAP
ncbi:MAG: O-antigen ligase family protein [Candidatus Hydrogenedentes bacterium]|nr:O-antigen ligase family protein [Candidatus Hydrogenedentota bacterium]